VDLGTFYAVIAATCFALVGLWWNVVESHPEWHTDAAARRRAGGVYLSFLLPGMMSILAQVDPTEPVIWRSAFVISSVIGMWSTGSLMRAQSPDSAGVFGRNRWVVLVLYALIFLIAVVPDAALSVGLTPLQASGVLLVLLIAAAHGLTWEFMLQRSAHPHPPRPG
jgi:hypothetical protein